METIESEKTTGREVEGSLTISSDLVTQRRIDFASPTSAEERTNPSGAAPDNCFGFGSYKDIFSGSANTKDTQFNYNLIDPYRVRKADIIQWICERDQADRFPHLAMRCNGVIFPGGLGEIVFIASYCIWVQGQYSDAKRLETATDDCIVVVQLPFTDIDSIQPIRFQNTINALHLKLSNGTGIEFVFMPGPFQKPEYFETVMKILSARTITTRDDRSEEEEEEEEPEMDPCREIVLQYLDAAQNSSESFELAHKINTSYNYYIGPTSANQPRFSSSSSATYRKQLIKKLQGMVERMKVLKKEEGDLREEHTGLKLDTDAEGNTVYINASTNESVSAKEYEEKYYAFIRQHEAPLLERNSTPEIEAELPTEEDLEVVKDKVVSSLDDSLLDEPEGDDRKVELPSFLVSSQQKEKAETLRQTFAAKVDELEMQLWAEWDNAMNVYHRQIEAMKKQLKNDFEALRSAPTDEGDEKFERKRSKPRRSNRRMSIVDPNTVNLNDFEEQPKETPSEAELAAIRQRQRRARRKSIVTPSSISENEMMMGNDEQEEEKKSEQVCTVCQDGTVSVVLKPCEHKICQKCFLKWFENDETCPYDRQQVEGFSQI